MQGFRAASVECIDDGFYDVYQPLTDYFNLPSTPTSKAQLTCRSAKAKARTQYHRTTLNVGYGLIGILEEFRGGPVHSRR